MRRQLPVWQMRKIDLHVRHFCPTYVCGLLSSDLSVYLSNSSNETLYLNPMRVSKENELLAQPAPCPVSTYSQLEATGSSLKITRMKLFTVALVSLVLVASCHADSCGGNCPSGRCDECLCGTSTSYVDISGEQLNRHYYMSLVKVASICSILCIELSSLSPSRMVLQVQLGSVMLRVHCAE